MTRQYLSMEILKRYMTVDQLEKLDAEYDRHVKRLPTQNRFFSLEREVVQEDRDLLEDYCNKNLSLGDIGLKFGFGNKKHKIRERAMVTALRLFYQDLPYDSGVVFGK